MTKNSEAADALNILNRFIKLLCAIKQFLFAYLSGDKVLKYIDIVVLIEIGRYYGCEIKPPKFMKISSGGGKITTIEYDEGMIIPQITDEDARKFIDAISNDIIDLYAMKNNALKIAAKMNQLTIKKHHLIKGKCKDLVIWCDRPFHMEVSNEKYGEEFKFDEYVKSKGKYFFEIYHPDTIERCKLTVNNYISEHTT